MKKKQLRLVALMLAMALLCGCQTGFGTGSAGDPTGTSADPTDALPEPTQGEPAGVVLRPAELTVTYQRVDYDAAEQLWPLAENEKSEDSLPVCLLGSMEEIQEYAGIVKLYKADPTSGGGGLLGTYDEAFFEEYVILTVYISEGSGSIVHEVSSITIEEGILRAGIRRIWPEEDETCTADMAGWAISIEMPRAYIADCQGYDAYVDDSSTVDLTVSFRQGTVEGKASDETFVNAQMELAVKLFGAMSAERKDQNVLISPLSIQLALAMTANGADGQTLAEMEALLGSGICLADLNEYLCKYVQLLPNTEKSKLSIANSIWFRDEAGRLTVEEAFLQKNADYYGAQIYKAPFDEQTVADINDWVDAGTDGMITELLKEIPESAVMYLINALAFDAQWASPYMTHSLTDGEFTSQSGEKQPVTMMRSEELRYLEMENAVGFLKPYEGHHYSFAALLPDADVDIYDFVSSLTAQTLLETLDSPQFGAVYAVMPKFSYEYSLNMNSVLRQLGMPSAFEGGFSNLGHSTQGPLFISNVLHKTFIAVDELGTKAGAVTSVEISDESAPMNVWNVTLDRPFVYFILDNATNLPVFMGILTDVG